MPQPQSKNVYTPSGAQNTKAPEPAPVNLGNSQISVHQQKVLKRINDDLGPPDTWSNEQSIKQLYQDVVLFGIPGKTIIEKLRSKKLPLDLKNAYCKNDCKTMVYIIMECPYIQEFLLEKKWDVKSRLLEKIREMEERGEGVSLRTEEEKKEGGDEKKEGEDSSNAMEVTRDEETEVSFSTPKAGKEGGCVIEEVVEEGEEGVDMKV